MRGRGDVDAAFGVIFVADFDGGLEADLASDFAGDLVDCVDRAGGLAFVVLATSARRVAGVCAVRVGLSDGATVFFAAASSWFGALAVAVGDDGLTVARALRDLGAPAGSLSRGTIGSTSRPSATTQSAGSPVGMLMTGFIGPRSLARTRTAWGVVCSAILARSSQSRSSAAWIRSCARVSSLAT